MGLKLYKIISRPPKVFRQYVFDEIPDLDFLQKSFDFRDTFFWDTRYSFTGYLSHFKTDIECVKSNVSLLSY